MKEIEILRLYVNAYYAVQKARIQVENRIRALVQRNVVDKNEAKALHGFLDSRIRSVEKFLNTKIKELLRTLPYTPVVKWMQMQKGVGHTLTAGIIAGIGDIKKFDTVSKLWSYAMGSPNNYLLKCTKCGSMYLAANPNAICGKLISQKKGTRCDGTGEVIKHIVGKAPKRMKNVRMRYSPFLRRMCWRLSRSFVRSGRGGSYRELYEQYKAYYAKVHDERCQCKSRKKHIDNLARRKTAKIFLQHLWVYWRQVEGLPVTEPYVIAKLGHKDLIPPPSA